jgi:hypothetical protein
VPGERCRSSRDWQLPLAGRVARVQGRRKRHGFSQVKLMVSWFIYDGAIRVHAINAVGRSKGRIIEVEVVDTGERFHGSARRLDRLVRTLRRSGGETDHVPAWTSDTTS